MARIQYQGYALPPEQITAPVVPSFGWFAPFSTPVLRAGLTAAAIAASGLVGPSAQAGTQPETTTVDRWHQPLALPTPAKPALAASQQAAFFAPLSEAKETVSEDKWHQPFSLPVWTRPALLPGLQQTLAEPVSEAREATTVDRWHQAFSLPVWRTVLVTGEQPTLFEPVSESPESVSLDRWLRPLDLPVWSRPALAAGLQQTLAAPVSESPESVSVDRWLQPFSQPRPVPLPVRGDFAFWSGYTPPVVAAPVTWGWFAPFVDPLTKPADPRQLAGQAAPLSQAAETTTVDRWHQPLALPQFRYTPAPYAPALSWSGFTPPVVPTVTWGWQAPLSDPQIRKLAASFDQAVAPVSTASETTTLDRWYQPLSEPVRLRLVIAPDALTWSGFTPAPVVVPSFGWFTPLTDPTRAPPTIALRDFYAWDNILPPPNPVPVVVAPTSVPGPADGLDDADRARQRWLAWAKNRKKRPEPPPPVAAKPHNFGLPLPPAPTPPPAPVVITLPAANADALLAANYAAMQAQAEVAKPDEAAARIAARLAQQDAEDAEVVARALQRQRDIDDDDDDVLALFLDD